MIEHLRYLLNKQGDEPITKTLDKVGIALIVQEDTFKNEEIARLRKENEELKQALLKGAKVIIKQDTAIELISAMKTIEFLWEELRKIQSNNLEADRLRHEYKLRRTEREYEYKTKHGLAIDMDLNRIAFLQGEINKATNQFLKTQKEKEE